MHQSTNREDQITTFQIKVYPFYRYRLLPVVAFFASLFIFFSSFHFDIALADLIKVYLVSTFALALGFAINIASKTYIIITDKEITCFNYQGKSICCLGWCNVKFCCETLNFQNVYSYLLISPVELSRKEAKFTVNKCEWLLKTHHDGTICFHISDKPQREKIAELITQKGLLINKI